MYLRKAILISLLAFSYALFAQQGEYEGLKTKQWISVDHTAQISISKGKTTDVPFSFHVNDGMHINSHLPSSELLIPTTLNISPAPQFKIGKIIYPKGMELALPFDPTEKLSVYTGTVNLSLPITVPDSTHAGVYTLHTEISYQACNDRACFPPRKLPVDLTVKVN